LIPGNLFATIEKKRFFASRFNFEAIVIFIHPNHSAVQYTNLSLCKLQKSTVSALKREKEKRRRRRERRVEYKEKVAPLVTPIGAGAYMNARQFVYVLDITSVHLTIIANQLAPRFIVI